VYIERKRIFDVVQPVVGGAGIPLIVIGAAFYWLARRYLYFQEGNESLSGATLFLVLIWMGGFLLCYGNRASRAARFRCSFCYSWFP
jgi:hypothetical protein